MVIGTEYVGSDRAISGGGIPQVLSIAGSDPGGGAGIQGDIKAISANGAYALSVVTSVTSQNTQKVVTTFDLPLRVIESQVIAIFDDFSVSAVKTGMLSSKAIVKRVALLLRRLHLRNLIVDPVMLSKSTYPLLQEDALSVLKSELIPLAALVTPNILEAERLANIKIDGISGAEEAARRIHAIGCGAVLVKGGHLLEALGCDILYDGNRTTRFTGDFIETPHTHGTGCAYSAAIAAHLARGKSLVEAIGCAKDYVIETIRHAHPMGHGAGPVNHFFFFRRSGTTT